MNKEQQIEEMDIQRTVEFLTTIVESVSEVIYPLLERVWEQYKKILDFVVNEFPDKRVVHLAIRHRQERVRKKNMRRIMRWIRRRSKQ